MCCGAYTSRGPSLYGNGPPQCSPTLLERGRHSRSAVPPPGHVDDVQARVRERRVAHDPRAAVVGDRVPRGKGRELPHRAGIDVHRLHPVRPVDERELARAGDPALVRDPLHPVLARIGIAVVRAVAADHPHPVRERARVEEQVRVVRMELRVPDRVALEDDRVGAGRRCRRRGTARPCRASPAPPTIGRRRRARWCPSRRRPCRARASRPRRSPRGGPRRASPGRGARRPVPATKKTCRPSCAG